MIVIIHGWSDDSNSFKKLAGFIKGLPSQNDVRQIFLGDYVSMDDEVTFNDVREAMQRAWLEESLPTSPRSVDIVVHSTGALVVRYWMIHFYSAETNPVRRFLMLAPANFGSPLAHKGRSFVGRVVKGYTAAKRFQTGKNILLGLELASPFSYRLACIDRFGEQIWYGTGRILGTVIVGTDGYSGISAAANEIGSDGTVRLSTANLNPVKLEMDFATDPQHPSFQLIGPNGRTAYFRVKGLNHSTAALKGRDVLASTELKQIIEDALSVTDDGFDLFCDQSDQYSAAVQKEQEGKKYTHAYQNTVVHLNDNLGSNVTDYFIEVFAKRNSSDKSSDVDSRLTKRIQEDMLPTVHSYEDDSSYRSLFFDVTEVKKQLVEKGRELYIALTAMPDISKNKVVGYKTLGYNDIGSIRLNTEEIQMLFAPDRTALVQFTIRREQSDDVFNFKKFSA